MCGTLHDSARSSPPLRHKGQVFAVAFAPDGRTLATGNYEDGTSIWSVADRDQPRLLTRLAANTESVSAVAFAPDGRTLATGVGDKACCGMWPIDATPAS